MGSSVNDHVLYLGWSRDGDQVLAGQYDLGDDDRSLVGELRRTGIFDHSERSNDATFYRQHGDHDVQRNTEFGEHDGGKRLRVLRGNTDDSRGHHHSRAHLYHRLRHGLWAIAFLLPASAFATVYTVTANNLRMEAGQTPPWVTWTISSPYTSALFTGEPTCTTTATSASAVGTYATHCVLGNMSTVSGGDSLTFVDGTMKVIAADGKGFQGAASGVTIPSGYFDGAQFGVINVTSNVIANMTANSFSATDPTVCDNGTLSDEAFAEISSWGRSEKVMTVAVTGGNTVTYTSGGYGDFTGLNVGDPVQVAGVLTTIATMTGTTVLTTASTALVNATGVRFFPPPPAVTTNGTTTVTLTDGTVATGRSGSVYIGGYSYTISSITDATHIVMTATVPTSTGLHMYTASTVTSGDGRQTLSLYFPHGCYLLTHPWIGYGNYITMKGTGSQDSFFRLKTASPQFAAGQPSQTGWFNFAVLAGSASQFNEFLFDLGFQQGAGNPVAEDMKWVNNNTGTMKNVQFYVDDSVNYDTVGLGHSESGPTLLKNIAVYGGNYGFFLAQDRYLITADQVTLEAQQVDGMFGTANGNHLSIQHLLMDEFVPAMVITARQTASILDSELFYSGGSTVAGVTIASTGNIHWRNLTSTGYTPAIADTSTGTLVNENAPLNMEGWSGTAQSIFDSGSTPSSLFLPSPETPLGTAASSTWVELGQDPANWCTTITGTSGTHLYFYAPPAVYNSATGGANYSCTIPDTVDYINIGYGQTSQAQATSLFFTWTIAGIASTPLIVDGPLYQAFTFIHTGTRTLVLKDGTSYYQPSPGAGSVFFEDMGLGTQRVAGVNSGLGVIEYPGPTFYSSQTVVARQLDIETGIQTDNTTAPKWQCQGCTMWVLGYKTEQNSPIGILSAGAKVELWGTFWYAVHGCTPSLSGASCNTPPTMAASTTAGSNVVTLTVPGSVYLNSVNNYQFISTSDSNIPSNCAVSSYNAGAGTITLGSGCNATQTETYTTGGANLMYFQLQVEPTTNQFTITNSSLVFDGFGLYSAGATGPGQWVTETRSATTNALATPSRVSDQTMNMFYSFGAGVPVVNASNTLISGTSTFSGSTTIH